MLGLESRACRGSLPYVLPTFCLFLVPAWLAPSLDEFNPAFQAPPLRLLITTHHWAGNAFLSSWVHTVLHRGYVPPMCFFFSAHSLMLRGQNSFYLEETSGKPTLASSLPVPMSTKGRSPFPLLRSVFASRWILGSLSPLFFVTLSYAHVCPPPPRLFPFSI